jgi:uncharacterized protein
VLPQSAFEAIVPVFIAIALVSIVLQPRLDRLVGRAPACAGGARDRAAAPVRVPGGRLWRLLRRRAGHPAARDPRPPDDLQRINALKNVLAGVVNAVAAIVFIAAADVAWGPAALIAAGSVVGAQLAARYGRRLSHRALRAVIVAVGLAAIVQLVA